MIEATLVANGVLLFLIWLRLGAIQAHSERIGFGVPVRTIENIEKSLADLQERAKNNKFLTEAEEARLQFEMEYGNYLKK